MSDPFWDQFADKSKIKFNEVGDEAVGAIMNYRLVDFGDSTAAELTLLCNDGETRTVLVGQTQLLRKLGELRPQVNDRIKITFSGTQPGKFPSNPTKLFDVAIIRAADVAAGVTPTAAPAAQPAPAAPVETEIF